MSTVILWSVFPNPVTYVALCMLENFHGLLDCEKHKDFSLNCLAQYNLATGFTLNSLKICNIYTIKSNELVIANYLNIIYHTVMVLCITIILFKQPACKNFVHLYKS